MKKKKYRVALGFRVERVGLLYTDHFTGRTWTRDQSKAMVYARKATADRRARKTRFATTLRVNVITVYRGDA